MKGRIANAIKATSVRTVERAPRAKRAPTQMRLALPSVPTVVLEIMRSAQQTPYAEPAQQIPQLRQKRPAHAFAMRATLVPQAVPAVPVLQGKSQMCKA